MAERQELKGIQRWNLNQQLEDPHRLAAGAGGGLDDESER